MSEFIKAINKDDLLSEANRCLKCKVAKCKKACPISTDIPTIMNLFLEGAEKEAVMTGSSGTEYSGGQAAG